MAGHRSTPVGAAALILALGIPGATHAAFREVDLVSDLPGRAARMDPSLVNPWGLVQTPDGVFRVSDNGTGLSTAYDPDGAARGATLTIPPPGSGNPTGVALSPHLHAFRVLSGRHKMTSRLIFVSEDGSITAWGPGFAGDRAVTVRMVPDAVYKGVAIKMTGNGPLLYATNFHAGTVDVFDGQFAQQHWNGAFTDPDLPPGYAPYNVLEDRAGLYVTFALQDADRHDDVPGPGLGYVDLFDWRGRLVRRVASGGTLNAPWGLAIAPEGFGPFGNALLVGNFGDGRISAFDRHSGELLGQVSDGAGAPISIDGLWSLVFAGGHRDGDGDRDGGRVDRKGDDGLPALYFTAGIGEESHGLFGVLRLDGKQPVAAAVAASAAARGQLEAAAAPRVALSGGNPFHASRGPDVTFGITLSRPTRVSLGIYDVSGRRVAEPLRDAELAGTTQVRWDRRDEAGARVTLGTYFYRAVAGNTVMTGRLVIVP